MRIIILVTTKILIHMSFWAKSTLRQNPPPPFLQARRKTPCQAENPAPPPPAKIP